MSALWKIYLNGLFASLQHINNEKISHLRMVIADVLHWAMDWVLPVGYEITTYSDGLEEAWLTLINESFDKRFTVDD